MRQLDKILSFVKRFTNFFLKRLAVVSQKILYKLGIQPKHVFKVNGKSLVVPIFDINTSLAFFSKKGNLPTGLHVIDRILSNEAEIIDLGAHVGEFSSMLSGKANKRRFTLLEYSEFLVDCLKKSGSLGAFGTTYEIVSAAISAKGGKNVFVQTFQSGLSRLSMSESKRGTIEKTQNVDTLSLNELLADYPEDVDLIKLDLEGIEFSLLKELIVLEKFPKVILSELSPKNYPRNFGQTFKETFELYSELYELWSIGETDDNNNLQAERITSKYICPSFDDILFVKKNSLEQKRLKQLIENGNVDVLSQFNHSEGTPVVIDCGSVGDYGQEYSEIFGSSTYLGFDPNATKNRSLGTETEKKPAYVAFALWEKAQTKVFYETHNPNCSSFFRPNERLLNNYRINHDELKVRKSTKLQTIRADTVLDSLGFLQPDIIELDVQGAELGALKSFGKYIDKTLIIDCEVEFIPIYHKQPLFDDIASFLKASNFQLIYLIPTLWNTIQSKELVWGRAIFIRNMHENKSFTEREFGIVDTYLKNKGLTQLRRQS